MKLSVNGIIAEVLGKQGPIGPQGPDGNPLGSIISYMGTTAPNGYLICDGTEYNMADYPDLAIFFRDQFGAENYFGGDGEITFAVPDLRNLFLRGYHGDAEEKLSGAIGEKQEATEIPGTWTNLADAVPGVFYSPASEDKIISPLNMDFIISPASYIAYSDIQGAGPVNTLYDTAATLYTSRPVNTAVLFCIKAIKEPVGFFLKKVSELENDAGYQTESDVTVAVGAAVASLDHLRRIKVDSIDSIDPTAEDADQYIYMVPKADGRNGDKYDEYMVIDGLLEPVGDWAVDLNDYVEKETGYGLYPDTDKAKLATVAEGATKVEAIEGSGAITINGVSFQIVDMTNFATKHNLAELAETAVSMDQVNTAIQNAITNALEEGY